VRTHFQNLIHSTLEALSILHSSFVRCCKSTHPDIKALLCRSLILEHAVYYVASPEACAAILWKSRDKAATVRSLPLLCTLC
jgi:hypothetical protein